MSQKMNKCKAPGCSKWVVRDSEIGYCLDHQARIDPLSSLYVVKSRHQIEADTRVVQFFSYLLQNRTLEELLY